MGIPIPLSCAASGCDRVSTSWTGGELLDLQTLFSKSLQGGEHKVREQQRLLHICPGSMTICGVGPGTLEGSPAGLLLHSRIVPQLGVPAARPAARLASPRSHTPIPPPTPAHLPARPPAQLWVCCPSHKKEVTLAVLKDLPYRRHSRKSAREGRLSS